MLETITQSSLPSLTCGIWGLGEVLGLEGTRWLSFGAGRENEGNKLVKLHSNYCVISSWTHKYRNFTPATEKKHLFIGSRKESQVIMSMCLQQSRQLSGILVIFEARVLFFLNKKLGQAQTSIIMLKAIQSCQHRFLIKRRHSNCEESSMTNCHEC